MILKKVQYIFSIEALFVPDGSGIHVKKCYFEGRIRMENENDTLMVCVIIEFSDCNGDCLSRFVSIPYISGILE